MFFSFFLNQVPRLLLLTPLLMTLLLALNAVVVVVAVVAVVVVAAELLAPFNVSLYLGSYSIFLCV